MYVAVTRAEKALFLTESEGFNRSTKSNKYPSRFLMEIGENLLEVERNIDPTLLEGTKNLVKQINGEINPDTNAVKFVVGDKVEHSYFMSICETPSHILETQDISIAQMAACRNLSRVPNMVQIYSKNR